MTRPIPIKPLTPKKRSPLTAFFSFVILAALTTSICACAVWISAEAIRAVTR